MNKPESILQQLQQELTSISTLSQLEQTETKYLGRNGLVNDLLKQIKDIPVAEKKEYGQQVNTVKNEITQLLAEKRSGNYLVTAHNGVNRLYMSYKLGMPLKNYRQLLQLNSAITQFTLDEDGVFTLQMLNGKL